MSSAFKVTQWAMSVPPIYSAGGRVDDTAHHVLLVLATFADKTGKARPGLPTLADKAFRTPAAVAKALSRLESAGLVSKAGEHRSVTVWQLALDVAGEGFSSVRSERDEKRRQGNAKRAKRFRDRKAVTHVASVTQIDRNAADARDVTPATCVTESPRNAREERASRTSRAFVTHVSPLQPQVRPPGTAIELPMNCQEDLLPETAIGTVRHRRSYPPAFEAFWETYGRKGAKAKAHIEWVKAIRKVGPRRILDAVPSYLASRPDPQYRKDAERWLAGECWESIPVAAAAVRVNGHTPYRNPADQNVYDEPLI